MKSFYEALTENGYSHDKAMQICTYLEHDLPIGDKPYMIYMEWSKEILEKEDLIIPLCDK